MEHHCSVFYDLIIKSKKNTALDQLEMNIYDGIYGNGLLLKLVTVTWLNLMDRCETLNRNQIIGQSISKLTTEDAHMFGC